MTSPFVSEVSVEKTKQRETTWVVSYPKRADINLSQVLNSTLCLTAAIHEEAALGLLKNSTHLSPVYGQAAPQITSDWQTTAESFLLLCSCRINRSPTRHHKRATWQVQLTSPCFYLQLCPTLPPPSTRLKDGLSDKWQQNAAPCAYVRLPTWLLSSLFNKK